MSGFGGLEPVVEDDQLDGDMRHIAYLRDVLGSGDCPRDGKCSTWQYRTGCGGQQCATLWNEKNRAQRARRLARGEPARCDITPLQRPAPVELPKPRRYER